MIYHIFQTNMAENAEEICGDHHQPIIFICRNQNCLRTDDYLLCGDKCLSKHFQHGKDLVSYPLLLEFIPNFYTTIKRNDISLGIGIRQTMNKLLHMKMSIIQLLDSQIQIVKRMLKSERSLPSLKDCVYLIKDVNMSQEYIDFDIEEFEKQVKENLSKTMSRLRRNVDSILKKGLNISQVSEKANGPQTSRIHSEKQYQLMIEGDSSKVVKELSAVPEHVTRLKIYLNQDTYGQNYRHMKGSVIVGLFSRIYKESYEKVLVGLQPLKWLKKIIFNIWDKYFERQQKREMMREYRKQMISVESFVLENKILQTKEIIS